jgi:hypothetical protein
MGVKPGLTRREEHRLRVFEIMVLRISGGKGNTGMKKIILLAGS